MPVIIAATDFTSVATNAVHFACNMAMTYKASVHLIHSFIVPVSFSDTPMPAMPLDDSRRIAEESMQELVNQLQKTYPGLEIASKVSYGDITDCLEEYTEGINPLMVVVGNSSEEGSGFWPGGNLISELKNLPCTVMAIPPDVTFKQPENICFACDFKKVNSTFPAGDIIGLVQLTGAQLHVLNVDHENKEFGLETPLSTEAVHEYLKSVAPVYHYTDHEDTEEGIREFVNTHGMDWLAVIPHKHSFVESLFRKSNTKAIARTSSVPLIAFHEVSK